MTAEKMSHLDGYHVAFGTVTKGLELVKAMGASYCVNEKPMGTIKIESCGVVQ
jgi:cyclophilin family peptidyl-prolyl cis-trans isomerase